ncbi:MAG: hypothetical protein CM15mV59_0060 [Caudoviricetes sp.]|nr:MAG: hypothetical protein CM15mV59_0060 [Caudoviricetes sp.]
MQKIINGIAIASGVVSLTVVGLGGYVFIRKDAIIDGVKSKIIESVSGKMGDMLPDIVGGSIPGTTGPALPAAPLPKF